MRKKLKALTNKERHRFEAEVVQFGSKSGMYGPEPTILFKNIRLKDQEDILTDHLWFSLGKQFERLNLAEGDKVSFNARVAKYKRGYFGNEDYFFKKTGKFPPPPSTDYKLERPSKIVKEPK